MKTSHKVLSKRKLIVYYCLLAFVLLAIAGTTTAVVLVTKDKQPITIEKPDDTTNGETAGTTDKPDDTTTECPDTQPTEQPTDNTPTTSSTECILPIKSGVVSTGYTFCYNATVKQYSLHTGLDITAEAGTEVVAVMDGKITGIYTGDLLEGNYITVSHADGVTTTYSFVDAVDGLQVGDAVKQGAVLGTVCQATGNERHQGAHLHFSMTKDGESVDPAPMLDIDLK